MFVKKLFAYVATMEQEAFLQKGLLDFYDPPNHDSETYSNWVSQQDLKTCPLCVSRHGKIYGPEDIIEEPPPIHPNCRCEIRPLAAVYAGNGTKNGQDGADWWLKQYGKLPAYYITEEEAKRLGWKWGKSPAKFAPGKMITMGVYENEDQHLPQVPGRIWYEADINYYSGRRNRHRVLWSNDGLLFVTYDHYKTFMEIV